MPVPTGTETEEEFVARCVPIVLADETAEDDSQAAAICHSIWDQEKKSTNSMRMAVNRIDGAQVTTQTRAGREWYVAPVIMLCPGVLNGELLTEEEISRHAGSWNGRPVMLGHPRIGDMPVSANMPDTLDTLSIGQVFQTVIDDSKLKAEVWIDSAQAQQSEDGREVLRRLQAGQGIEVSTAYWRDLDEQSGSLDGVEYVGVARQLVPDHLAFLLHDVGACSIADGCGVPRANQAGNGADTMGETHIGHEETLDDGQTRGIGQALRQGLTSAFRWLIREAQMDERIQAILDVGGEVWDEDTLGGLSQEQLEWLQGHLVQAAPITPVAPPAANTEPDPKADTPVAPDIRALLDEYFADMGGLDAVKAKLQQVAVNAETQKAEIAARLAANERCALTEAQLSALDLDTLTGIEASLQPADYRGQAGGLQPKTGDVKIEPLAKPVLFGKEE